MPSSYRERNADDDTKSNQSRDHNVALRYGMMQSPPGNLRKYCVTAM